MPSPNFYEQFELLYLNDEQNTRQNNVIDLENYNFQQLLVYIDEIIEFVNINE